MNQQGFYSRKNQIEAKQGQDAAGKIRRTPGPVGEAFHVARGMPDAPRRRRAHGDQREGQPDAEAKHEGKSHGELLKLEAEHENGKGSRAREQASRQTE